MAIDTALVTQLTGQAWLRSADGELIPLRAGMRIPIDAEIVTGEGASVRLQAAGMPDIVIGENREFLFSMDVVDSDADPASAVVGVIEDSQFESLVAAIKAGQDPFDAVDPTAAVLTGGGEGNGGSFVRLNRVLETTSPLAVGFRSPAAETAGADSIFPGGGMAATEAAQADTDTGASAGTGNGTGIGDSGTPGTDGPHTPTVPPTPSPEEGGSEASQPAPRLTVTIYENTVEFVFDQVPVGFDVEDVHVANGTISNLLQSASDPKVWTAELTPSPDFEGEMTVFVPDGSYTNDDGVPGRGGADSVAVDTLAPEAEIKILAIAGDGIVNDAESRQNNVSIVGTVGRDVKVGDTVTVFIGDHVFTGLVGADKTWSTEVPGSVLAQHASLQVRAQVVTQDEAGNAATASTSAGYGVDLSAQAAITIDTVAGDDVLNDGEALASATTVTGTTGGDVKVGDTVTLLVNGNAYTGQVTVGAGDALIYSIDVATVDLLASPAIEASVTARDTAGNSVTAVANKKLTVDREAEASITIDTVAGDDVLNDEEASSFKTTITGTAGGDAKAGDTVTLLVNGNVFMGNVVEDAEGELVYSVDVDTSDLLASLTIEASVTTTDAAGNSKTATAIKAIGVDREAEASISIDPVTQDDVLNDTEASALTTTVSGTVGGDVKAGDMVTLMVNGRTFTGEVNAGENGELTYSIGVTTSDLLASPNVEASVVGTDEAGNRKTATASKIVGVDREAEASITVDMVAGDDVLNDAESSETATTITGTVGGDVKAGDTVVLTVNGNTYTGYVAVGADGELGYSIEVPTADLLASSVIEASVTATDTAGNSKTATAVRTVDVDREAEASITIDAVAGDDVLNNDEALAPTTTITGSVGGDVKVGDTVTLTVNGNAYTGQVMASVDDTLIYNIDVTTSDLLASPTIEASVTATDEAGNSKTATASKTVGVDRVAEALITIDTVAGDDVLNNDEASASKTTITGTVGGDAKEGDTVTLTINDKTFTGQVTEDASGELVYGIDVTTADLLASPFIVASVTTVDAAGNTAVAIADRALAVDREAEALITIDTVAGDNVLNDDESSESTTTITGTVGGDVKAGDTITLTVNGNIYTGHVAVGVDGVLGYNIAVTTSDLLASPVIDASVTAIDAAGNVATATAGRALIVDREAEASITIDTVAGDDVLNNDEASASKTTITGTVGGDAKAGDTVTLTVNGNTYTAQATIGADNVLVYSIDVTTADLLASPFIDASVTARDSAGNSVTAIAIKALAVDRVAEASITIDKIASDDVLNDEEALATTTTITGVVGGDVKVGDTVTLMVNGSAFNGLVVESIDGALVYSIDVATSDLLASPAVEASVTATDGAGNSKTATAVKVVSVDREAEALITIDVVAGDDVLNDDESSMTATIVKGTVGGDAKAGDTVTLTINGNVFTGNVVAGAGGELVYSIEVDTSDLLASPTIEASVTTVDEAGNSATATANKTLTVDRVAEATITIDAVADDDVLNKDESSEPTTMIAGKVGGDAKAGDTVTLTVDGNIYTGQVTVGADGVLAYNIDVATSDLLTSPVIQASVTATDAAGNSKTATAIKTIGVDREAEASISIDTVAEDDVLNDTEASAPITTVSGTVGGDVKAGDTVTLTVNDKTFTGQVTVGAGGALVYGIDVTTSDLLSSPVIEASVTAVDAAGNTATATANKTLDIDREAQASISIDMVAGDDVLNEDEASESTTTVTGSVGGDVKEGDTVVLTVNGSAYIGHVIAGVGNTLVYSIDVTTADLLASPVIDASVTATDAAGNRITATAIKTIGVDREAEASISIDTVAEDDVLNNDEALAPTTTITGRVGGDVKVGDTVTLTVNGNTFTSQVTVGADDALIYSIDVTTADLLASPAIEASVTAVDAAGNSATATASRTLDIDREAQASISIDTVAGDDILNEEEAAAATITITGTVGGDVKAGDTVTLTVNGNTYTGYVTVDDGGGLGYSIAVTTSDLLASPAIEANVTAMDAAGNSATATANKALTIDRVAEASITIDTVAGDDVLNDDEASESTTTVTGSIGGDVKAGDTVTLTVNGNAYTGQVTAGTNDTLIYNIDVTTSDLLASLAIEASVTATDEAGNSKTATASKTVGVDRVAEASITIDAVAEDDILNDSESSALVTTVSGTVGGDVKAGDLVTLTVNGNIYTGHVAVGVDGVLGYSIAVTTSDLLASPAIEASVTAIDAAGNVATATAGRALIVDRVAEASIIIDTVAGDDVLNDEESLETTTAITGAVGGDAKAGDTVTLTVNGNIYTGQVTVSEDGVLAYSINVATSDLLASPTIEASVLATDAAGNSKTATAIKTIGVDREAEASITIDAVAGDDVLNNDEALALTTTITGSVGGDLKVGDTVTLTVNGNTFTGHVSADAYGSLVYSIDVTTADLLASPAIEASVTATDAAGNTATATASRTLDIDSEAEASISIDTVAEDDVLNDTEASTPITTVSGTVGGDVKAGDTVTLTINDKTFTGQVTAGAGGALVYSIEVTTADLLVSPLIEASVTATDAAGNTAVAITSRELAVDREAAASITIDTVAGDDVLNDDEASESTTTVTGSVGGDVKAGDTVTLMVNGNTFTGQVVAGVGDTLIYSIDVTTSDLLISPAIEARVIARDTAGNSVTAVANKTLIVDREAEASITIDMVAGDDVLNEGEALASATTVTGTAGGDVKVGDTVTLLVNGNAYTGQVTVGTDGELIYSIEVSTSDLLASLTIEASVLATDAAGNSKTAMAVKTIGVDREAEASISIDTVAEDDVLNDTEASTLTTTVSGTVGGDVKAGDTVTLTINDKTFTGQVTVGAGGALVYSIDVSTSDLLSSPAIEASVTATDAVGNSATATANKALTIDRVAEASITVDTVAGDDVLNDAESSETATTITGTVGGDVKAGDTVVLTVNGNTYTGYVTVGADGELGYSIEVPTADLLASSVIEASVTATDTAGNSKTATAVRTVDVDREAEASIFIDTVAEDDVLNDTEASTPITTVSGTVGGDVKAGDLVTLTVNGNVYTGQVTTGTNDTLIYNIDVTTSDLLASPTIEASVTATDAAGNSATATANKALTIDRVAEASITIDTVAGDNILNDGEASAITTTITGTVGGDVKAGDTVILTVNGNTYTGYVTVDDGGGFGYSIAVTTSDLLASPAIEANVTATDAAGNSATATANKALTIDRVAEASITIDTVAEDDILNDSESSALVTTVSGTVGGDVKAGDLVTLTVNGKEFTGEVSVGEDDSLVYSIDVSTSDLLISPTIEASVTALDTAGNSATAIANRTLIVDREAEASITIDTVAGDDVLNDDEASESTTMVTGTVGGDVKAGDTVTLTVNGNTFTGQVMAGVGDTLIYSIDVSTSDLLISPAIEASVTARDTAGNSVTAVANKTLTVDREAEASISIDTVAEDDVLNDTEASTPITTVSGTVGGDVKAGDTVTLTVNDKTFTGQVTVGAGGALVYSIDVSTSDLLSSPAIEASVTATDAAGNSAMATANKALAIDRVAEASITIDTVAGDDVLNNDEALAPTTTITGRVGGDVKVGDTVTLTVNGNTFTGQVTVGVDDALIYSIDVTTADLLASPAIEASVTAVDAAGNTAAATANKTLSVDREAQASISIDTVAGDDILNEEEAAAATITITGTVGGDVKAGDTVTLTVNGNTYTGQATTGTNGTLGYSIDVAMSDLVVSSVIEASVTATDEAGNSQTVTATRSITVDVSAPEADGSTVTAVEDETVDIVWQDLNIRGEDVDYIVVTHLPGKGMLEYQDQDGSWKAVNAGQTFTPEQFEPGLRFTPDENESGQDYAGLSFHAVDKVGNIGETATITIDVTPVADAPDVSLTVSEGKVIAGSGSEGAADIIQVNGGSGQPGGFDVQDGKIIRIGDGVRVWLTEGDFVPEIVSSGSSAPAGQIRYYDAHGNPHGDGQYADIFVIHENSSGFYRQSDWPADRKDPRDIQAVHGNSTSNGPNAYKDYIFVQGNMAENGGPGFDATYQTNNNNATHVNTLDGVFVRYKDEQGNVKTLVRSGNQIEGIIFGDGQHAVLADADDTAITREDSVPGYIEYELQASAALRDLDGSESLSGITLTGLPEGTILSYGDTTVTIGADGRHLIVNPHDYAIHPVAGEGTAGSSFTIDVTIKVPAGSGPFTLRAEAIATEMANQQASQGHAEAAVDVPTVDTPTPVPDTPAPDTPEPEPSEPDAPGPEAPSPEVPPPQEPGDPEPTGSELLLNGDFRIYANAGDWGPGNPGNIYGGFKHWTASADFMSDAYRMENKPYVGVWKGTGQDIYLKQHVSGVTAGTVLELDLAWNNPNHGAPAGGHNAGNPDNTGRSVSLEITFGGVVYAVVTTPLASASVADSQYATVTAFNGAQANIGQIETWYNTYAWRGDDAHPLPSTVEGIFDKLQITLPDDVALTGDLQFRWIPGSETIAKGQNYMDDLMIANVKALQGVPPESSAQAYSLLDDGLVEDDDASDYVYDTSAIRLNSILDDGTPEYDADDGSSSPWQFTDKPAPAVGEMPISLDQPALELELLFTDAGQADDSLEHYLIPESGKSGIETVVETNQGAIADSAGNSPNLVILHGGMNVDFAATDMQSELIQNMIADGKQKVDQT